MVWLSSKWDEATVTNPPVASIPPPWACEACAEDRAVARFELTVEPVTVSDPCDMIPPPMAREFPEPEARAWFPVTEERMSLSEPPCEKIPPPSAVVVSVARLSLTVIRSSERRPLPCRSIPAPSLATPPVMVKATRCTVGTPVMVSTEPS